MEVYRIGCTVASLVFVSQNLKLLDLEQVTGAKVLAPAVLCHLKATVVVCPLKSLIY
jgi:hypothetical protein